MLSGLNEITATGPKRSAWYIAATQPMLVLSPTLYSDLSFPQEVTLGRTVSSDCAGYKSSEQLTLRENS